MAACEAPVSLGTDTGGSIRQPAALCGIVGVKPTYGRVSRYGLIAFASSLDQVGPFAKDALDAALMLQAVAGHDPRDSTSAAIPVPDYAAELDRGVRGLRVGIPAEYFIEGLDAEVEAAVRAAGGEPALAISNGGLDANWLTARGIPAVTVGAGVANAHTTQECLDLGQFHQACRIALHLATGRRPSALLDGVKSGLPEGWKALIVLPGREALRRRIAGRNDGQRTVLDADGTEAGDAVPEGAVRWREGGEARAARRGTGHRQGYKEPAHL